MEKETLPVIPKGIYTIATVTFCIGSYFIGKSVLDGPGYNLAKEEKYDLNVKRYQKFVLGCTLFGMGLNFFSYYYYPYSPRNYHIQLDPMRRSGLWALFGCGIGLGVGKILFLSF